jgi:UDP-N-acetylglucosamine--N-acetylmuramyl-(pentapeptide) pyrophosphoryl-undecaprenol N-acetylglucosamine transferase
MFLDMQKDKVIFCGGGTLGPVTPLLAVIEAWRRHESCPDFIFVGTPRGPERELVEKERIRFETLPEAKLTRYPSLGWLFLPFKLGVALFAAWKILLNEKPSLIVSAGGYTAVPLIVVGRLLKIPSWIHQQDVRTILSNKLSAPFASLVTVAWNENLKDFSASKTKLIGNPVREAFLRASREEGAKFFGLDSNKPTVLILGGGTGSLWLNQKVSEIIGELLKTANVIHLTGKGKMSEIKADGYRAFELLTEEMSLAFAVADLVVCRAGLGTITELAATRKPAIVIPLPNSPQEDNAIAISSASIVLRQSETDSQIFFGTIIELLKDQEKRNYFGRKISEVLKTDVAEEMVGLAESVIG